MTNRFANQILNQESTMSFKTKAIGIVAAGILGISAFGGAALADSSGSTATFQPNPNGVCSAGADSSNVDFGTYVWDGAHYVTSVPAAINFSVTSTFGPGTGCNVNIGSTALVKTGDPSKTVPVADIVFNPVTQNTGSSATIKQAQYIGYNPVVIEKGHGTYTGGIYLNGLYSGAYDVGTYTGTMTFTANVAP